MQRRNFLASLPPLWAASTLALNAQSVIADERKMNVAVIGHTGRGNYGHGLDTMWLDIPGAQIVAVADPDEAARAAQLKKLRANSGYADYREMLTEVRPDIVAIGPRHVDQHRDYLLAAIAAGVKGIYVEKPFVRTPAEADEVIAAASYKGTKIAIAHRNRYHPVLPVVKKLIEEGAIGRVLELRGRGKEDPRGGALDLWVLGSHVFDLAIYFAGAPQACSATLYQDGKLATRDHVTEGAEGVGPIAGNQLHARYEMEKGWPLFFDSLQNATRRTRKNNLPVSFGLQIIGTEGIVDFRVDQQPLAAIWNGSPFDPDYKQPQTWLPITSAGVGKPESNASIESQVTKHIVPGQDLMASIHENRAPLCDAAEGLQIVEMITAVFESHRLSSQRVAWPLKTRVNPLSLM